MITAHIDDLDARDLVGDVRVTVESGPRLQNASAIGWDEALGRLAPLFQQPLLDKQCRDWWAPLKIDLAALSMAYGHAESWRDSLITEGVDRVVVATRLPSLWRAALAPLPVTIDHPRTATRMLTAMRSAQAGELLKLVGVDGGIRRIATPLATLPRRARVQRNCDWMLVGEIPTPSMLGSLLLLPADRSTVVACDPRVAVIAARQGHHVSALWPPGRQRNPGSTKGIVERARRLVATAELGGLEASVERLVRRSLPGHIRALEAFRHKLSDLQPQFVVMASDQHKYGVLSVWAAEDAGISTMVIQHGLPVHPIGYLPVRATIVACMGSSSRSWFQDRGTPPARLSVTGSPRMPTLEAFRIPPGPVSRLLVALNPGKHLYQRQMLDACVHLASVMPELTITIRPHPGDRRLDGCPEGEALSLLGIPVPASQFRVDGTAQLSGQLATNEVLMVHDSTVGVEALLAGTPVVVFSPQRGVFEDVGLPHVWGGEELHTLMMDSSAWLPSDLGRARESLVAAGGSDAVARVVDVIRQTSP